MPNTYTKIHIQLVFAVQNRNALLQKPWRQELFSYMAGTIHKRGNYTFAVNGVHDHVHLFFDYKGKELLSSLVRELKKSSNDFIKANKFTNFKFNWQEGYGAFSHGYRERDKVINYIKNQEEHHRKKSFQKEYLTFLDEYEMEFKDEYLFSFFD